MPTAFDNLKIGNTILPTRLVRSAVAERMVPGIPGAVEQLGRLYMKLLANGTGLVITGHIAVHSSGCLNSLMPTLTTHEDLSFWKKVCAIAHSGGGLLFAQLNHAGGRARPANDEQAICVALQPERPRDAMLGQPATEQKIESLVAFFAQSASLARQAGFDGLELHAAHGYLGSQFLSPLTNTRNDHWGGSLENRSRFVRLVTRAVRQAVGTDFPMGMKLGALDDAADGVCLAETLQVAEWLQDDGLDFIEISGAFRADLCARHIKPGRGEGYFLEYARKFREKLDMPVMAVGGFRSLGFINGALSAGHCDAVAMARPLIRQPDLARVFMHGGSAECISCNRCLLNNSSPTRCHMLVKKTV